MTKCKSFVGISNSWAYGFQIPFKFRTIFKPTCFRPFKIQTSPDLDFKFLLSTSLVFKFKQVKFEVQYSKVHIVGKSSPIKGNITKQIQNHSPTQ